jgi:hypothetical protein
MEITELRRLRRKGANLKIFSHQFKSISNDEKEGFVSRRVINNVGWSVQ